MATFFISDIHLQETCPALTELFLLFLQTHACGAEALYILGDLFEAWIGDDEETPLSLGVCQGLTELAQAGTRVYIMHGNRDFLLGSHFADLSSSKIISDPYIIDLYGVPTLLTHGDTLCTADQAYLNFRQQVRDENFQQQFLAKPLAERKQIARKMRMASQQHQQQAEETILDATPSEIPRLMQQYQVSQLIHGHTHRPAIHYFQCNGKFYKHFVLSDWDTKGSVLVCTPEEQRLIYF